MIVLAVVQGITEFLPISSSAHLNLVHLLSDWRDQGALMDAAIHAGSLVAVIIYFWRDVVMLTGGALDLARGRMTPPARLLLYLVLASVPVFIAGFVLLSSHAIDMVRTLGVIATANLIFAALLYHADRTPGKERLGEVSLGEAMMVGLAQMLALVPGVSRSGVTMTAARYLGISRTEAARFSMLLAIPTILGAGAGAGLEIYRTGDVALADQALIAAVLSFVTALIAIWAMMAWLRRMSFTPFVIYRVALSLILFAIILTRG